MRTILPFLKANVREIARAFLPGGGGPIVFEVPLGSILLGFGCIFLANHRFHIVETQYGYAGLEYFSDLLHIQYNHDLFWGIVFVLIGGMKFIVTKPVLWRIVSTSVMMILYLSLFINFAYNSPLGFVWLFFLQFTFGCGIALSMLIGMYRSRRHH